MEFIYIDMPFYMIKDIKEKEKMSDFKFSNWVVKKYHQDFLDEELLINSTKKSLKEAQALVDDYKEREKKNSLIKL